MLQIVILLLFTIGFYLVARNTFGIFVAWISLVIVATPNFFVLYTSLPFPDFIYSVGWAGGFYYLFCWVGGMRIIPGGFSLLIFILGIALLQLIKPNATTNLLLFALSLGFVTIGAAKFQYFRGPIQANMIKSGIMTVIAVVVATLIVQLVGKGPLEFAEKAAKLKIVYFLPPASQSSVEMKVEVGKAHWQAAHGMKIEDENFLGEQPEIPFKLVKRVWLQRLTAYPLHYVRVILEEFLCKHYIIIDSYMPFSANTKNPLYVHIMPISNTIESRLYRSTGLWVDPIGEGAMAIMNVSRSIIRVILFWSILLIGWFQLFRKYPVFVAAMTMGAILYAILNAATVYIDSRHMLVFAIPFYLTEAVGLATIIRFVIKLDFINDAASIILKKDGIQGRQAC